MNHEMDDDVKDILALLQQGNVEEKPVAKKVEKVEKAGKTEKVAATKQNPETPPKSEIRNRMTPQYLRPKKRKKRLLHPHKPPLFWQTSTNPKTKACITAKS